MKIKNILTAIAAVFTLGFAVSCDDNMDPTLLSNVQVSNSYVAINQNGGSATITVNATDSWSINGMPSWLSVSPSSGSAGNSTVTLSAEGALDGRTAELALACGSQVQRINVIQGLSTISPATCAEVIAGPDSKNYRVTGVCTKIANTQYGNWYLEDGTGEVYIYGTLDAKGNEKNFLSLGIEVGDVVTVEGPKTTYGSTVELVNVTVVKLEKSLIKCDSTLVAGVASNELPIEGGEISAFLTNKGTGLYVEIPENAKSWLGISSIAGNVVTFCAQPNNGGDRSTTITFKTKDSKKEYTTEVAIAQKGAIIAAPVADFLAAAVGDTQYRLTGMIKKVANTTYGNFDLVDYSGSVYVYGIGAKGDFEKLGLKEGDIVTLVGKRTEYKGTAQVGSAQYETSISTKTVAIADFNDQADGDYYMISGTIDEIANATYGNVYLKDEAGNRVYVYGCYPGYGATGDARKNLFETLGIKVGDKLTVVGPKSVYKDVPQINGGFYFSHESAE